MFFVMRHEMPYGMMITTSHNPAVYNGIKVFTKGGRDADELQTQEIERYIHGIEEEVLKSGLRNRGSDSGGAGGSRDGV